MNNLSKFTKEELNKELKRREEEEIPILLENPDFTNLKVLTERYLFNLYNYDFVAHLVNRDYDESIYECIMRTLYGPNIFNWINKKLNGE